LAKTRIEDVPTSYNASQTFERSDIFFVGQWAGTKQTIALGCFIKLSRSTDIDY